MPRLPVDHAVPLDALLTEKSRRAYQLPQSYALCVTAAYNLAATVAGLHAQGHHVIDLKPVNTLVYRGSFFVALLDCDGFSIAGTDGTRYPAHQYTPGYIAPEAQRKPPEALEEAQDRFALAVLVFRLLSSGLPPFQGVPHSGHDVPSTTQARINERLYAYGRRPNARQPPAQKTPRRLHNLESRSS